MKLRITMAALACLALVGVAWLLVPSSPTTPQRIHLAGFTNGVVGAVVPIFATLRTNNAATIQRWFAEGTNGAVFTITNQQSCAIWLFPLGRLYTLTNPMGDETPLLNAPNFSGIRLPPGQATTVQVAVTPHQTPWRLQLFYHRDGCSDTFLNKLKQVPEEFLAVTTGRPVRAQMHTIESDLIDR